MRLFGLLRTILLVLILVLFVLRGLFVARGLAAIQPPGIDFLPMWTGARMAWTSPELLYDFKAVTVAQGWLMSGWSLLRPFVYPPSVLPVLAPFAAAPFFWAYAIWTLLGAIVLAGAVSSALNTQRVLAVALVLASPPAAIALIVGQATLLVGGMITLAVVELPRRPRLAGVLFGLAAAIKPQAAVLVPLGLVAARAWTPLGFSILAGASLGGLSLLMVGWRPWLAWLDSIGRFAEAIDHSPTLMRGGVTLTMMGANLGLDPVTLGWVRLAAAGLAVIATWLAFRRGRDPAYRLAALGCGALVIAPYAMHYEATLMAPAAVLLALSPHRWLFGAAAVAALALAMKHDLGGTSVLAVAACATAAALHDRYRKGSGSSRS